MPTRNEGFTLLEIVIVVAILAFVAVMAIPKLSGRKAEVQSMVRKIAITARELKYKSKLQNATYRLVIQIVPKPDESELEPTELKNQFWVEKAPGSVVLGNDDEESKDKDEDDENAPPDPNGFIFDQQILKEPEVLPEGMVFERVELASQEEPITEGIVYIYFLPEGFVNESAIHLEFSEKLHWTIAIHPLTGRADIFDEDVPLESLRQ